jgi:hypothetical protein
VSGGYGKDKGVEVVTSLILNKNITYTILRTDGKDKYVLKAVDSKKNHKLKSMNETDANILVAQMNDMSWEFAYKSPNKNKMCMTTIAELDSNKTKAKICSTEKGKYARVLGLASRFEHLLK